MRTMTDFERAQFEKLSDERLLALAMFGEARGESELGQVAVGFVIFNRATKRKKSIKDIILQDYQFSCFLPEDRNFRILQILAAGTSKIDITLAECERLANLILTGKIGDITKGADHYFNPAVVKPTWATKMIKVCSIGAHEFYRS